MQKNTAGKWVVFAFDRTTNIPKTGDAANITANVRIDEGAANAVDDTHPAELESGYYVFDITAAEANGDNIVISPSSTTANIQVIGVPGAVWTTPPAFNALTVAAIQAEMEENGASILDSISDKLPTHYIMGSAVQTDKDDDIDAIVGYVDKIDDATDGLTAIKAEVEGLGGAAMRGTDSAALASVCTETRLAELDAANLPANVDTLLSRISSAVATALSKIADAAIAGTETAGSLLRLFYDRVTGAVALDSTVAKEATLANANYGLSALKTLIDTIDTSTELQARFTEIKGAGWTTETLAAIDALIDLIKTQVDKMNFTGMDIKATLDGEEVIPTTASKAGYALSTTSEDAIATKVWAATIRKLTSAWTDETPSRDMAGFGLTGTRQVTITIYKKDTVIPIPEYQINIYNSGVTLLLGKIVTDANGQVIFNINDGTYKLRGVKFGYNAVNVTETLVVDGDETVTYYATELSIGIPADVNACRVYEFAFMPDDVTPMAEADVLATATITKLPYDYDGKYHSGQTISATLEKINGIFTGRFYFDLVHLATVKFDFPLLWGTVYKTIPAVSSKRLKEI